MKALVLSIIIALSASSAFATGSSGCALANSTFGSSEGAFTKNHNTQIRTANSQVLNSNGSGAIK